jgi:hypothetical protein
MMQASQVLAQELVLVLSQHLMLVQALLQVLVLFLPVECRIE